MYARSPLTCAGPTCSKTPLGQGSSSGLSATTNAPRCRGGRVDLRGEGGRLECRYVEFRVGVERRRELLLVCDGAVHGLNLLLDCYRLCRFFITDRGSFTTC